MPSATAKVVTVAKQRFELTREQVEERMRTEQPEPILSHYVVIENRRFPPKQVIGVVTGIDRADFTSHQARRILMGLGFPAGREPRRDLHAQASDRTAHSRSDRATASSPRVGQPTRPPAKALEPYVGQWVATRGPDVLVADEDPRAVVSWLAQHRQRADSMFRVPEEAWQASGLAPL